MVESGGRLSARALAVSALGAAERLIREAARDHEVTEFEYFFSAISIVLALTVARCLDALPAAFEAGRRYWVHATWLIIKLANPVVLLWTMWEFRDVHYLSFISLLGAFALVATVYLQVIALVTTRPDSVPDWRAHYFAKRRLFFGVNVLGLAQLFVANLLVSEGAMRNPTAVVQLAMISLSLAGIASDRPRLHEWIAVLAGLNMFVACFGMLVAGLRAA